MLRCARDRPRRLLHAGLFLVAVGDPPDSAVEVIRDQHRAVLEEHHIRRPSDVVVVRPKEAQMNTSVPFTVPSLFRNTARMSPPNFLVRFHEPWRAMKIAFLYFAGNLSPV